MPAEKTLVASDENGQVRLYDRDYPERSEKGDVCLYPGRTCMCSFGQCASSAVDNPESDNWPLRSRSVGESPAPDSPSPHYGSITD